MSMRTIDFRYRVLRRGVDFCRIRPTADGWPSIRMDNDAAIRTSLQGTFLPPEKVGFSPKKLREFTGTIVCTGGMSIMVHFVRPTPDGSELRTRFWIGYSAVDGKVEKIPGFTADPRMGTAFLLHNVKEFTHLAKILPEVYAEYKDNFTVAPFHNPDAEKGEPK